MALTSLSWSVHSNDLMISSPALLSTYSASHSDSSSCGTHLSPSLSLAGDVKWRFHDVTLLVIYRAKANFLQPAFKAVPKPSPEEAMQSPVIVSNLLLSPENVSSCPHPGWPLLTILPTSQPQAVNSMRKLSLNDPLTSLMARPSLFHSSTILSTQHPPRPPHTAWTSICRDVYLNKR